MSTELMINILVAFERGLPQEFLWPFTQLLEAGGLLSSSLLLYVLCDRGGASYSFDEELCVNFSVFIIDSGIDRASKFRRSLSS